MRVRYSGPDEGRNLALPGAFIYCPQGAWVDLAEACEAAGIPAYHATVAVLAGLEGQAGWDVDATKRRRKAAHATEPAEPAAVTEPAEPAEAQP